MKTAYIKSGYNKKSAEDIKNEEAKKTLKQRIGNKDISGVYVFWGEEEYLKRSYLSMMVKICGNDAFSYKVMDGKNFSLGEFVSSVRENGSLEADSFLFDEEENAGKASDNDKRKLIRVISPDFSALTERDVRLLCECLECAPDNVTIVFSYFADKNITPSYFEKGVLKKICENALVCRFVCEEENSPSLKKWCGKHFAQNGIFADERVIGYLISAVGSEMSVLESEIQKLCGYVTFFQRTEVKESDIDIVCVKTEQAQIFDVSNNAISGNYEAAFKALEQLKAKKTEALPVFGAVVKSVFDLCNVEYYVKKGIPAPEISRLTGMKEYPVKKCMAILSEKNMVSHGFTAYASKLCVEFDDKLKSFGGDGYRLLGELIFRLTHVDKNV